MKYKREFGIAIVQLITIWAANNVAVITRLVARRNRSETGGDTSPPLYGPENPNGGGGGGYYINPNVWINDGT